MIRGIKFTSIPVRDQDVSLRFFTEKLGAAPRRVDAGATRPLDWSVDKSRGVAALRVRQYAGTPSAVRPRSEAQKG